MQGSFQDNVGGLHALFVVGAVHEVVFTYGHAAVGGDDYCERDKEVFAAWVADAGSELQSAADGCVKHESFKNSLCAEVFGQVTVEIPSRQCGCR